MLRSLAQAAARSSGIREVATDAPRGPVYIVFGASGGIGSALCQRLAAQQGAVVEGASRNAERLRHLAEPAGSLRATSVDVMDEKAVQAFVDEVDERHGRVDGVVNCAGNLLSKSALTTSAAELRDTLDVNLVSCFNVLRPAVRAMLRGGRGSIAFVSSAAARHGLPNYEAFAAAKAGVIGLTRGAASTYSTGNIRVNCVAPGLIKTPLTERFTTREDARELTEAMHPLKRVGTPDDVAAALEFLLHPNNAFITGQVYGVDGGLASMRPADLEA